MQDKDLEIANFLSGASPLEQLQKWINEMRASQKVREVTAMTISTVGEGNLPSSRVVLCKEVRKNSVVFFTNYDSHKGQEISANNKVAANFYWDPFFRQVKIQGHVTKVSRKESEEYWASRPRESQLSGFVSQQSKPVDSRDKMERLYQETEKEFSHQPIPCPQNWGGFELHVDRIEFWIGRENRFHDRFAYQKVQNSWVGTRLFP